MNKLYSIVPLLFLSMSCVEEATAYTAINQAAAGNLETHTIRASLDESVTKTSLSNGSVLWNSGDAFSVLYEVSDGLSLLTYSTISGMAVGESRKVMITSLSHDGCILGTSGSSWSTTAISGFSNYGSNISSSQASANEATLLQLMNNQLNSNASKATFTITKVSSTAYTIQNSDSYYLSGTGTGSGTATWSSNAANLTIENATGTSASSTVVSQSNNPSLLRIRNSSGYPLYNGSTSSSVSPYWYSGQTGGWTLWYMYEIPDGNREFTTSSSGASSATFEGSYASGAEAYYALYPYNAGNSISDGVISFSAPSVQTYTEGSFESGANPSVGILENDAVSLKNLFGVLKLTLKSDNGLEVTSITVKDKNESANLWGDVSLPTSTVSSGALTCSISGGSNSITLNCGGTALDRNGKDFYIVAPVGSFANGLDLTVETSGGTYSKSTTVNNSITRSMVKAMPALSISSKDLYDSFCIENEIVHDFVAASYGSNTDFTYSAFAAGDFASRATSAYSSGWRTDYPAAKTISWDGTSSSYTVTVSDGADYSYAETVSASSYDISDLAPGKTYSYTVTDADGAEVLNGQFMTTGQLRMIRIDESWNVRDLGGWQTNDGKTVRYGKLFRGGHLDNIGTVSQNRLAAAGVRAELDLRGLESDGGTNYGDGSYAHDSGESLIPDADYQNFYIDAARDNPGTYPQLVQCVAWAIKESLAGKPVYFHCKSGADRTGQISVLILGLLGVKVQDIEKDYETTNFGWEKGSTGAYSRQVRALPNTYMNYLIPVINACEGNTFQEKCRYYLHSKFSEYSISEEDMDAFTALILE